MSIKLSGAKVLVVGLKKSGMASAELLLRHGAAVSITDLKALDELPGGHEFVARLGLPFRQQSAERFEGYDLIVLSPDVPADLPQLLAARASSIPVIGEVELAAPFLQGRTIGITGSNGKTTTTTLIGEILEAAGLPTLVGGNIGVPVVALIDESTPDTWSVLEVSSFQLESTEQFHPQIAVILNITPDHLDRHGTFENYARAKERIFAAQTPADFLVLNADNSRAAQAAPRAPSSVYWFSLDRTVPQGAWVEAGHVVYRSGKDASIERIIPLTGIPLKGEHNVENVLAAVCAARLAGAAADVIRTSIENFRAVEHRLEYVATLNGVEFFNDSKATNVDATAKAIASFNNGIHLILGGKDKNSDYTQLAPLLRERVRAVYTIGSAADKIESQLRGVVSLHSCETLDKAVTAAASAAHPGDVVLLAPACSSFDQFESYEHRGRVFKELVNEWRGVSGLPVAGHSR
jgi:UDP-N-acetylmuramoylalanine--D-glutamate ligase